MSMFFRGWRKIENLTKTHVDVGKPCETAHVDTCGFCCSVGSLKVLFSFIYTNSM